MTDIFSKQLKRVYLNSDIYSVCLTHALSTEKEEVMGLLLGQVDELNEISYISSYLILRRSDKQADRVEISSDQLAAASMHAEQLSKNLKQPIRVVGWYHSHPHITVWPSHVDVRTQAMYQMIDPYFVGLIFSIFPNDVKNKESFNPKRNEIQLTCFQSKADSINRNNFNRLEIPIYIRETPIQAYNLDIMTELPEILKEEEDLLSTGYNMDNTTEDPLVKLHNKAHKFNSTLHITSQIAKPLFESVIARIKSNEARIKSLEQEKERLLEIIAKKY